MIALCREAGLPSPELRQRGRLKMPQGRLTRTSARMNLPEVPDTSGETDGAREGGADKVPSDSTRPRGHGLPLIRPALQFLAL
jgi:hypothetical protein